MAKAARLAFAARRNELCTWTMRFVGVDWSASTFAMQVRGENDMPGPANVTLGTVGSAAAQGLKVVGVTFENGVPVTTVSGRINKSTMGDTPTPTFPYADELGDDARFVGQVQVDGITRVVFDPFWVVATAFGSDNAPTDRPLSYSAAPRGSAPFSTVSLTFSEEEVIQVKIDGVELLAPFAAQVQAAAAGASADRSAADAAASRARASDLSASASSAAIAAAIAGYPNGAVLTTPLASRALLAAIANPAGAAFLTETGRIGAFVWTPGDQSALVSHDPLQFLAVAPATQPNGSAGAWLRDYQSGEIWVDWGGGRRDGVTDDTAVIQAAIDLTAYLGGGDVRFAKGVHIVAGQLKDTAASNSQIVLPKIDFYENTIALRLRGAGPRLNAQGGSVLRSTLTTGNGSVISCKHPHASTGDVHDNMTSFNFTLEDITVDTVQSPTISRVDASYCYNAANVRSIITVTGGRSHNVGGGTVTFATATTSTSYGWKGSLNDLPLSDLYQDCLVFGFFNGYRSASYPKVSAPLRRRTASRPSSLPKAVTPPGLIDCSR